MTCRTQFRRTTPAQEALARREAAYAEEVRRLLDAALGVMRECGTASRPRVADIVAAAGLSNDAFYRHFRSKDALVAALVDDGALRLRSYLDHQMAKASTPDAQVRRWVEGVMSQAEGEVRDHHPRSDLERRQRQRRFGTGTAGRPAPRRALCWRSRSPRSAARAPSSTPR